MATFDASRPLVAAMAVGVGRAALDFVKDELAKNGIVPRYDAPPVQLTAIERDLAEMEAELQAARLLTWRAAAMMNRRLPNNLEASMAKAKAGAAVTKITQKASSCSARSATRRSCSSRSGCATPRSTTSTRARSRSTC